MGRHITSCEALSLRMPLAQEALLSGWGLKGCHNMALNESIRSHSVPRRQAHTPAVCLFTLPKPRMALNCTCPKRQASAIETD